jgi:uncharacterized protein (TIGR02271 family)
MLDQTHATDVLGRDAYDRSGDKIGKIGQLYFDDDTGQPAWMTVNTGFFGTSESFVPLEQADVEDDRVVVPFEKQKVKDAPTIDADQHISREEEQRLYEYYGLEYRGERTGLEGERTGLEGERTGVEGRDVSGPTTDTAMTRSEEHLEVGTRQQETGRARLRKYVVTEQENVTVPVRKERAVVETEPVTESNVGQAMSGPELSEEEHEVTLHEERPVVEKAAEPVERVRLGTEEVESQKTVSEEVRKERIEAEGDVDERRR